MKKILSSFFFLLFIALLFIWNDELASFWANSENHRFLISELITWSNKSWLTAFLMQYGLYILVGLIALFGLSKMLKKEKKRQRIVRENPLTGGKAILEGDDIISKSSLPESEKEREKAREKALIHNSFIPKWANSMPAIPPKEEDDNKE